MFNTQIIEGNIKLLKQDQLFSVNYTTRNREMLGLVDQKNLTIYKNDKGNYTKMFQFNLLVNDLRDVFTSNSIYFFSKEYVLAICGDRVYRVSTRTTQVDSIKLKDFM